MLVIANNATLLHVIAGSLQSLRFLAEDHCVKNVLAVEDNLGQNSVRSLGQPSHNVTTLSYPVLGLSCY